MPDRWLDVSVRKVLRPITSIQVFFLGFPVSWKQMLRWFPNIQDVTTCFSCSPPTDVNVNFSSTVSSTCICVQNHCHRTKAQLQLNKYYILKQYNKNINICSLKGKGGLGRPVSLCLQISNFEKLKDFPNCGRNIYATGLLPKYLFPYGQ